ncbi:MAG: diaminopimelate decarboxylase [Opitutales bacterium]
MVQSLVFLTRDQAFEVREKIGTPAYVYDERSLKRYAASALRFPNAFGLTVRYAMKASPNASLLRIFDRAGLSIDASSAFECERAMKAGIAADKISLSTQELPRDFGGLIERGVTLNACSLDQLKRFGEQFPGARVGMRFNPGIGSGGTRKTNVGGPSSSFGIWHEYIGHVKELAEKFGLEIFRIHTHIGSGSDPEVWQRTAHLSLNMVREFPSVRTLNLGGGYKVARMPDEKTTDLTMIGSPVCEAFEAFYHETGRKIRLEIEPGTYLVANACSLLTTVQDIVDTGAQGHRFLKLDTGMTEILRPSLYGAQHPLVLLSQTVGGEEFEYVVVGHCCESGDLITPAPDQPDVVDARRLPEARVGDLCVIEGAGAYCSSMAAKNYNSFPEAPEVLLAESGETSVIRRRQTLEQMIQNEG